MIPTIKFHAHTQARMAAADARKKAAAKPAVATPESTTEEKPGKAPGSWLKGHVAGLSVSNREAILKSPARVAIACGSIEYPTVLMTDVNRAVLQHYIPEVVRKHLTTIAGLGATIFLPYEMERVTVRGLKYVIGNMLMEMREGSYHGGLWTKDDTDTGRYTIRPRDNPVDMMHALNTLRAFGMEKDARFLVMEGGLIAVGMVNKAREKTKRSDRLDDYLVTVSDEVLGIEDQPVLAAAWKVYYRCSPDVYRVV